MLALLQVALISSLVAAAGPESGLRAPPPPSLPAAQGALPMPPPPPSSSREIQAGTVSLVAPPPPPPSAGVEDDVEDAPRLAREVDGEVELDADLQSSRRLSRLGLQLDVGVPEGLGLSVVLRPVSMLRVHGGVLTYGAGFGLRGGVTLAPWNLPLIPTLTAEAGHLFSGGTGGAAGSFVGPAQLPSDMIESLSYDFASALVGLEFGAPNTFMVYVRAGLSYVDALLQGRQMDLSDGKGETLFDPGEVRLKLTMPSIKLGLVVYF